MRVPLPRRSSKGDSLHRLVALALCTAVFCLAAATGAKGLVDGRGKLIAAHRALADAEAAAARLPAEQKKLEQARKDWNVEKVHLWRSAESGVLLRDLEAAASSAGAKVVSVEPGERVEKFYRGHLRAVPVKISLRGTFPQVLATMTKIEDLASPGEARELKIFPAEGSDVPGEVRAEAQFVFYSLNPPEEVEGLKGSSGRYDPFFPLVLPEAEKTAPQSSGSVEAVPQGTGTGGGQAGSAAEGGGAGGRDVKTVPSTPTIN